MKLQQWPVNNSDIPNFQSFITIILRGTFLQPSSPIHVFAISLGIFGLNTAKAVFLTFSSHHPTYSLYDLFCYHFPYQLPFIQICENYGVSSWIFSNSFLFSSLRGWCFISALLIPPYFVLPLQHSLQTQLWAHPALPSDSSAVFLWPHIFGQFVHLRSFPLQNWPVQKVCAFLLQRTLTVNISRKSSSQYGFEG